MNKMYRYLLILVAAFCLVSCDKLDQTFGSAEDDGLLSEVFGERQEDAMEVTDVNFSSDYKTFTMTTNILRDIGPYELADSTKVRTEVIETLNGIRWAKFSAPRLVNVKNIEAERIAENGIKLLVLVDLTLPQSDLDRISSYVKEMMTSFNHDNLYVAFMEGENVSNTMKVTNYVIDNHFKKSSEGYVYLYRSILNKRDEMVQGGELWQDATKLIMLTFSDERVYNDETDEPIDPDHYLYEEEMAQQVSEKDSSSNFLSFYASFNHQQNIDDDIEENVLWFFCNNNGGTFIRNFNWVSCKNAMLGSASLSFPDNEFTFENPDFKVYRGDDKRLTLNFYTVQNDSLIASVSTDVVLGEVFDPIIVNGQRLRNVILQGLFIGVFILLLVYIVLQLIVPFIGYVIFKHKYIVKYTGHNMCYGNTTVEESCYLCKAPFEKGDKIVVKCSHTMHKTCWDENEYHCPEYSDRCKHGSHYYNNSNHFDGRNAPFYLKWILVAVFSALLAWLCFTIYLHQDFFVVPTTTIFAHKSVTQTPDFGLFIGFFLTAGISILSMRPGKDGYAILRIFLRACLAAIGCYASFFIVNYIIMLFDISKYTFILNWIPWTASGFVIAFCSTFATRIVHSKLLVFLSVLLGFLSMYAWSLFFCNFELDYRVMLLFSFIIFSVGLSACIATIAPRSEHFYLKVQGATKGMDIALYKWLRNSPERVVTIGKSVDCSLQLSWDIQSDVAPVQAKIYLHKRIPYLTALEPGVFIKGKPVKVNKKIRLYHGKTFAIGQTTFTYIEKDK